MQFEQYSALKDDNLRTEFLHIFTEYCTLLCGAKYVGAVFNIWVICLYIGEGVIDFKPINNALDRN